MEETGGEKGPGQWLQTKQVQMKGSGLGNAFYQENTYVCPRRKPGRMDNSKASYDCHSSGNTRARQPTAPLGL